MPHDDEVPERAFLRFGAADGSPLTHLPALDGLRGLAVVAVVLFHGNWEWARGGFLGVSLFFTLSGFLITSLLIAEHRRSGYVDLVAFWGRRFRRLLPAALLTVAAVVAVLVVRGEMTGAARLDVWAAIANVANWRFLAAGSSYNDLFSQPSPLRHYWSLAIEEQAYLVVPVVVAVALRFGSRALPRHHAVDGGRPAARRTGGLSALAGVLGVLWCLSVAATLLTGGHDRVYYGTHTRAAELLIGALLAVAVAHEPIRRWFVRSLWGRWGAQGAAAVALLLSVVAWNRIRVADTIVADGGLVIVGLLSSFLVLGCAVGTGPVATVAATAPLRFLGRISYGVYLFHWPIFVLADEQRTGLDHLPRFLLAVAVTLFLATASHRFFEQPMRRTTGFGRVTPARFAPLVVVVLVISTLAAPTADPALGGFDAERAAADMRDLMTDPPAPEVAGISTVPGPTTPATPDAPDAPPPVPVPTMAVFGDSVSLSVAYTISTWALTSGRATFLGGDAELGCGIGRGGKQDAFGIITRTDLCDGWPDRWGRFVDTQRPDLAIVQTAQWELIPRMIPGDDEWRIIGDPVYDAYLHGELLAATDLLARNGSLVVWLTFPYYSDFGDEAQPAPMRASHDPERVDRLNTMVRQVAAERPDTVRIVDLAGWMADKVNDPSLRKDGAHFNSSGTERLATDFLAPELLGVWDEWYRSGAGTREVAGG